MNEQKSWTPDPDLTWNELEDEARGIIEAQWEQALRLLKKAEKAEAKLEEVRKILNG